MNQDLASSTLRALKAQIRLLAIYSLILTAVVVWLALKPGRGPNSEEAHYKKLTAEQIDIVEPDGKVKLALFNKEHLPIAEYNGMKLPRSGGGESGLMFYNEEGTECGGLVYSGKAAGNHPVSGMALTFDKYNQDQELWLDHEQDTVNGLPVTSNQIIIADRPDISIDKIYARVDSIKRTISDTAVQRKAIALLNSRGDFGFKRAMFGRRFNKDVGLFINDEQGKPRLNIYVDKDNQPHIRFYDESGQILAELPSLKK